MVDRNKALLIIVFYIQSLCPFEEALNTLCTTQGRVVEPVTGLGYD